MKSRYASSHETENVKNAEKRHCRIGKVTMKRVPSMIVVRPYKPYSPDLRNTPFGKQFYEMPQFWEEPYKQTFHTDRTGSPPHPSTLPTVIC